MYATRRLWAVAALVAALAVFAVLLERPLLIAGSAVLSAWLLAQQLAFSSELDRIRGALSIDQLVDERGVRTDETTVVTLEARLEHPGRLAVTVEGGVPKAAMTTDALTLSLAPGETRGMAASSVTWPVVGRHRFSQATVTVTSPYFDERLAVGSTPEVIVEPRRPRRVHVGSGGNRIAAYGAHDGNQRGSGVEPSELREYTSGDTANRIDWKATARLRTPYVREYEAETERPTLLIVDTRSSMTGGTPGETKLEYLREVALAMADTARRQDDPVGLLTVDDADGSYLEPATGSGSYTVLRRRLLDLEVTPLDAHKASSTSTPEKFTVRRPPVTIQDGRAALVGDDSFVRTLRPFYASRGPDTGELVGRTLPAAVRTALGRSQRQLSTVVFTDDTRPAELHELATVARRQGHELTLILAPTVLYEPGGLADVERAYTQYLEFEELRRHLTRLDRVTALEAGPDDRLASVLAAGRTRGDVRD